MNLIFFSHFPYLREEIYTLLYIPDMWQLLCPKVAFPAVPKCLFAFHKHPAFDTRYFHDHSGFFVVGGGRLFFIFFFF